MTDLLPDAIAREMHQFLIGPPGGAKNGSSWVVPTKPPLRKAYIGTGKMPSPEEMAGIWDRLDVSKVVDDFISLHNKHVVSLVRLNRNIRERRIFG